MAHAASLTSFADTPEQPDAICLTFGKYRGVPLSEIETGYLEWVQTADRITPELLTAIKAVLAERKPKTTIDRWRPPVGTPTDVSDMARLLIEAGEQELRAALGQDFRVAAAVELLKAALNAIELESDPGTLPPF
jgi:hypothetical protein